MKQKAVYHYQKNGYNKYTFAELTVCFVVLFFSILILITCLIDKLGFPLNQYFIIILSLFVLLFLSTWIVKNYLKEKVHFDKLGFLGFTCIVLGTFVYILLIALPFMVPVANSVDLVHHIQLIDYITQHQHLVQNASQHIQLLGEMGAYFPGAHILAYLISTLFHIEIIFVLHPLISFFIAIKVGLFYNILLTIFPYPKKNPVVILTGILLLFFLYHYFLFSFIQSFFFSMVIAETFVVASLWALIKFANYPSSETLVFFTICNAAILVIWPPWMTIILASFIIVLIVRKEINFLIKTKYLLFCLSPLLFFILVRTYSSASPEIYKGIIMNEGYVVQPSTTNLNNFLYFLSIIGIIINIRNKKLIGVYAFFIATIFQIFFLYLLAITKLSSFYFANKMYHIFIYPLILFAIIAIENFLCFVNNKILKVRFIYWVGITLIVPLFVFIKSSNKLASINLQNPPINKNLYSLGVWAKNNIPVSDVYFSLDNFISAYWLQVNVFGNPRYSPSTIRLLTYPNFNTLNLFNQKEKKMYTKFVITKLNELPSLLTKHSILYQSGPYVIFLLR